MHEIRQKIHSYQVFKGQSSCVLVLRQSSNIYLKPVVSDHLSSQSKAYRVFTSGKIMYMGYAEEETQKS